MSKLIDGKVTSKKIKDKIAAQVAKMIDDVLLANSGINKGLKNQNSDNQ